LQILATAWWPDLGNSLVVKLAKILDETDLELRTEVAEEL
jgi:hypothetical protein